MYKKYTKILRLLFSLTLLSFSLTVFAKTTIETISKDYLLGKTNPTKDRRFVSMSKTYSKSGHYLQKETYEAFKAMHKVAKLDGIDLIITSGFRGFDDQKHIWTQKYTGMVSVAGQNLKSAYSNPKKRTEKILNYSSMPGTSRHHWGTDIDINNKSPDYWNTEKGMKEYSWLSTHAKEFGFCQTYNTKEADRATGYNTEKWHWSYTPLAKNLLIQYEETVNYSDITGFPGSKTAEELNIIEDYVSSINPECR